MTRKHFRELADNLRFVKPDDPAALAQWEQDVRAVADACAVANGGFDRSRFYAACMVDAYLPSAGGAA